MVYKINLFTHWLFLITTKAHHKPSHKNYCNFTLPIFIFFDNGRLSIYKDQISHDHTCAAKCSLQHHQLSFCHYQTYQRKTVTKHSDHTPKKF